MKRSHDRKDWLRRDGSQASIKKSNSLAVAKKGGRGQGKGEKKENRSKKTFRNLQGKEEQDRARHAWQPGVAVTLERAVKKKRANRADEDGDQKEKRRKRAKKREDWEEIKIWIRSEGGKERTARLSPLVQIKPMTLIG